MKHLDELRRLREIHAPEALKLRTLEAIEQGKEVTDMKKLKQKTRKRLAAVLGAASREISKAEFSTSSTTVFC